MSALRWAAGWLRRWWAVCLIVVGWQLVVSLAGIDQRVLPGPVRVVSAILADPVRYFQPMVHTVSTAAIGLVLGVALGYAVASLSWLVPALRGTLTPVALIIRSVPFVALIPVLARIFGYGVATVWVICALACFFPTYVLVSTGLNEIPAGGDDVFRANGASRLMRYRLLAVPASLPQLGTSIRISGATSLLAALIAEFLMGTPGLSRELTDALDHLAFAEVWAASTVVAVLAIVVFLLTSRLESIMTARWR